MRKLFNLFAAALVMLAAASCEKNEVLPDNNTNGKVITLKATINNGETKTSLGKKGTDGTYPVLWSKGDEIVVIQIDDITLNQVNTFRLSTGDETTSATFTCVNAVDFDPSKDYLAVYPASAVDIFNGFKGFNFSSTQTYKQNSFGDGVMPMLAYKGENSVLNFTNAFGILKLQLKGAVGEKVKSIVITSDKPLNGKAVHMAEKITLVGVSDENKKLTLDCGAEGVELNTNEATDFLISIPPGEHNFTITVNSTIGDIPKTYNLTTTQTIEAGAIKKMAVMDFSVAYIENGVYLGDGVALPNGNGGNIIWAPVNCGYDADHTYGLLYQWGRKDGQDYSISEDKIVSLASGVEPEADKFYTNWSANDWDKTPCPRGWRIPTIDELTSLRKLANSTLFYGTETESNVSLPLAGSRKKDGTPGTSPSGPSRDYFGYYWSSSAAPNNKYSIINFAYSTTNINRSNQDPACGYSVRCVKE